MFNYIIKNKIYTLSIVFNIILYMILIIAILAPFTFQKIILTPIDESTITIVPKKSIVKKLERPLHQVVLPKFSSISSVQEKKKQFFDFLRPTIIAENNKIETERRKLKKMLTTLSLGEALDIDELKIFTSLVKKYKVNPKKTQLRQATELLKRVDIIPQSLVLVQAANESAWGTSRFSRIGLNFFGIWCYREGCGMVPNGRNHGAIHEVAAFKSVEAGIKRYLYNINTNPAYQVFRAIRAQLREHKQPLSPQILATGLLPYSERGADYVLEMRDMLRHNRKYLTVK